MVEIEATTKTKIRTLANRDFGEFLLMYTLLEFTQKVGKGSAIEKSMVQLPPF